MSSIEVKVVKMNKQIGESLLSANTKNRSVKKSVVNNYVRDIIAGNWRLTNQGIAVSRDGVLLDGQHRLLAMREAGWPPLEIIVVSGLDPECQDVIDQHTKRSARDIFALQFNNNVNHYAPSICAVIYKYGINSGKSDNQPTISELFDVFNDYKDELIFVCESITTKKFFAAPHLAAFVMALHKGAEEKTIKDFICSVMTGEELSKKMPAFHLRNFILFSNGMTGGGNVQKERFLKTQKAIDAYLLGQEMGVLRL